jgi:CBS domain-containing protein
MYFLTVNFCQMGELIIDIVGNQANNSKFIENLLKDIKALEIMLEKNVFDDTITRIGSEQELCLIDSTWRPTRNSEDILKDINDPHFTTELAKFNLEINLDPIELKGSCFKKVSNQLVSLMKKAKDISAKHDTKVILTGILPTISENELEQDYMTARPRYLILNEKYREVRGDDFRLHIRGLDELRLSHDSILFEACNTSFQMHLQIASHDFISSYNWAKAISGPVLGVCTNSPLLLGRELWSETRVALFRQSIDTRMASRSLKDQDSRVTFGNNWAKGTVADIFKDDIANFKILISKENTSDSLEALKNDETPKLEALNLHNGTIYRWNRACYGITNGKPHVRIENRYIPAGPSIADEIANFAFWVGIMVGRPSKYDDMPHVMDFRDAKSNFVKAARHGSDALLNWDGKKISVKKLAYKVLLPIAYKGLKKVGINKEDRRYFLGIIEKRIKGQSGSEWMTANYRVLKDVTSKDNALRLLTRAIYNNQIDNTPVHNWPPIKGDGFLKESAQLVGHIMSTKLFTVHEKSLANLATSLMKWKNIHHVPVENEIGNLTGLLTWKHVQKFSDVDQDQDNKNLTVAQIMEEDVMTVTPQTHIKDAMETMKKHKISCLPVVKNLDLVGIITITDLIAFYND